MGESLWFLRLIVPSMCNHVRIIMGSVRKAGGDLKYIDFYFIFLCTIFLNIFFINNTSFFKVIYIYIYVCM